MELNAAQPKAFPECRFLGADHGEIFLSDFRNLLLSYHYDLSASPHIGSLSGKNYFSVFPEKVIQALGNGQN